MANGSDSKSQSESDNIEMPSIPRDTAGAVAGALVGSAVGPIGTVVGGVVGAFAAKAAGKRGGSGKKAIKRAASTARSAVKSASSRGRASWKSSSKSIHKVVLRSVAAKKARQSRAAVQVAARRVAAHRPKPVADPVPGANRLGGKAEKVNATSSVRGKMGRAGFEPAKA